MNLPNKITMCRLVLAVLVLVLLMFPYGAIGINVPIYKIGTNVTLSLNFIIAGILFIIASFTDFLDGLLARKWGVSTIFGSLLDMSADKIFGISLLVVLSTMYPIMTIPLVLEVLIGAINIKNAKNGGLGKSSEIGRIKTWVMGLSVCSILLTGLSNDLLK